MKNLTKKTQTILFASLIAAMILPFSGMNFAQAELTVEDVSKITALFEKSQKVADKIANVEAKQRTAEDPTTYDQKLERLKNRLAVLDQKISDIAPIRENIEGQITSFDGISVSTLAASERYTIVDWLHN